MKFAVPDLKVASRSWPLKYPYKLKDWCDLNQVQHNDFIDLLGMVDTKPILDANSAIPKTILQISNDALTQEVEILGAPNVFEIRAGDTVAFSGLKLREWNGRRSLQSSYLTMIERNPAGVSAPAPAEGPKRKAIRIAPSTKYTILQAQQETSTMLASAREGRTVSPISFSLVGSVQPLTKKFFDDDAPLLQKGDSQIMCWKSSIKDTTGSVSVKIWDKACYDLFGVTSNRLREMWEEGVDSPEEQDRILDELNEKMSHEVVCLCRADVWRYGRDNESCSIDIGVNDIDIDMQ